MNVQEKVIEILKNPVCDNCLGRAFSDLLSGYSNEQRGKILRQYIAFLIDSGEKFDVDNSNFYGIKFRNAKLAIKKPEKCKICKNFFIEQIDQLTKNIVKKLKGIEFDTFLVGSILSDDLLKAEEKMFETVGVEFV